MNQGDGVLNLPLRGFGNISVRKRQSDLLTVRQVFREKQYAISSNVFRQRCEQRYSEIISSGKTPVIVDAGANIGAASLWFSRLFANAHVIAVEPESSTYSILEENCRDRNITHVCAAIGSKAGFVDVIGGDIAWAVQTRRAETGLRIVTIADAVAMVDNGSLFIVKIDIEGFEDDLFSSDVEWLEEAYAVFVEPHDWMLPDESSSRSLQKTMAVYDFHLLLVGENLLYIRRNALPAKS